MRPLPIVPALILCLAVPARADKRLDEAVAKAEAQLAKGREDEAVKILQKAATRAPRDAEAQLALGTLLARLGKLDEAEVAFGKAGELAPAAPPRVRARVLAGRSAFALRAGTSGESLELARTAVATEAGAESLAALARAQARRGEPAARETAERATRAAPTSAAAHLARGEAFLAAHLSKEAEAAYRRALELAPRSAPSQAGLALALAGQGHVEAALAAARAATELDPRSAEALASLGLVFLAQDPQDKSSDAVSAVQQGSFLEPRNPLVKLRVGRVFESRGQAEEAAAAYGEAAGLDPSWAAPRVATLALQSSKGDAKGALAGLRALPEELQASGEAQLLLGRLLSRTGDPSGAKRALDRAVLALPGLAEAQAAHGDAAYDVGELALAAEAYGRAAQLAPGNRDYRSRYGLFLAYDGRLQEALSVLLELTAPPQGPDAAAFMNLGWVYRHFKPPKVAEAVAAYTQALKLEPKNGEAALGVALGYRAAKQWARAASAYERVVEVDPEREGEAMLGVAWCHYRGGDDYKARFYTGLAVKAGADVGELREALGVPVTPGAAQNLEDERAQLARELGAKNAGVQVRAARGLVELGQPAVPTLAAALARKGTSIAAREAIVDGLGRLGPAARAALPQLERLIKAGPPRSDPPGSGEEDRGREERLVRAMQAAALRIRGQ
jgi:tetratricopeptide (TPR) repeat protein